jgi:hypothetical protein
MLLTSDLPSDQAGKCENASSRAQRSTRIGLVGLTVRH